MGQHNVVRICKSVRMNGPLQSCVSQRVKAKMETREFF